MSLIKLLTIIVLVLAILSPAIKSGCEQMTHHNLDIAGPMCIPQSLSTFLESEYMGLMNFVLPLLFVVLYLLLPENVNLSVRGIFRKEHTRASLLFSAFSLDVIHNPFDFFIRTGGIHRKITP